MEQKKFVCFSKINNCLINVTIYSIWLNLIGRKPVFDVKFDIAGVAQHPFQEPVQTSEQVWTEHTKGQTIKFANFPQCKYMEESSEPTNSFQHKKMQNCTLTQEWSPSEIRALQVLEIWCQIDKTSVWFETGTSQPHTHGTPL